MTKMPTLLIVSGDVETGKTRFSQLLAQAMQAQGWDIAGIVSPAVLHGKRKIAIDVHDLRSGRSRRLAERVDAGSALQGPATRRWQFSQAGLDWSNSRLETAIPCDLLFIDEIGPLEFEHGAGMLSSLEAIDSGSYLAAVIVIRSSLLGHARQRWPHAEIIDLGRDGGWEALASRWVSRLAALKAQSG
jgi:nucleoside-triphosphatase THEP1